MRHHRIDDSRLFINGRTLTLDKAELVDIDDADNLDDVIPDHDNED